MNEVATFFPGWSGIITITRVSADACDVAPGRIKIS